MGCGRKVGGGSVAMREWKIWGAGWRRGDGVRGGESLMS